MRHHPEETKAVKKHRNKSSKPSHCFVYQHPYSLDNAYVDQVTVTSPAFNNKQFNRRFNVINPLLIASQMMSITTSTRAIRIDCPNYNSDNGEFLHPPCRSESRWLLQHCGGLFAEVLRGVQCEERRDVNVYVSMFDSLALAIHNKFESYWREPKIVLVTSINPKIVGGIQQDDSWCYIGCSNYIGYQMGFANAVASLSYRVALSVSDHTDSAAFLAFDMEVDKLTNIQASEAVQIVGSGVDAKVDTDLPQSLADIVGNTYTFQLKEGATVLELEAALPEVDVPDQMPKLITRSMLQLSHLLPMIHQLDVQLRPKNNLLWMRMSQIKHVWNN
ncbi:unnamed protein product [Brassica rapa subsp. trilocularis]